MKKSNYIYQPLFVLMCFLTYHAGMGAKPHMRQVPMREVVRQSLDFSIKQSLSMAETVHSQPGKLPKSTSPSGELVTSNSSSWTSGFFPGQLWYLYEYSKDNTLKKWAEEYTQRVKNQMYTKSNHDVGFMIFCSFGNAYRITGDKVYLPVIDTASQSLCTRFNDKIGSIRSWDFSLPEKRWQFPVIIDNMMNLEMLMWASKMFHNRKFSDIALTHANTTLKNHFRDDYSCFHVVSYSAETGRVESKETAQGFSNSSAWARGQAWALYGFTMMYRETGKPEYLTQAMHVAHFILSHPRLPADKIPYWDFDVPGIPNAYRDASAGAIICSALLELSAYVDKSLSKEYLKVAEIQLRALSSPKYRVQPNEKTPFILKHSVGNLPNKSEVDVSLAYADYYFVEALTRYRKLMNY